MNDNNFITVVNKEKGITSHDVINRLRAIFKTSQIGHLGTLDPNAEGVLVVCVGKMTKLAPYFVNEDKKYHAQVIVGLTTDTDDITGDIINKEEVVALKEEEVDLYLSSQVGLLDQLPPKYSAVKINGKKAYQYARAQMEVDIPSRKIQIYELYRTSEIVIKDGCAFFDIYCYASKGTFIRSICRDLGRHFGFGATTGTLIRIASGDFTLEEARTLNEIASGNYLKQPITKVLTNYTFIELDKLTDEQCAYINPRISNGMKLSLKIFEQAYEKIAFCKNQQLLALYALNSQNETSYYKAEKVWK